MILDKIKAIFSVLLSHDKRGFRKESLFLEQALKGSLRINTNHIGEILDL